MKVLVCGGRHYKDFKLVWRVLNAVHKKHGITQLINGGCSGADTFAKEWAEAGNVEPRTFKADWALGPAAGPLRNQQMLDEGKPDVVLAFPGGRGTIDMVRRSRAAGVRAFNVDDAGHMEEAV
jgi:hypothetical protein